MTKQTIPTVLAISAVLLFGAGCGQTQTTAGPTEAKKEDKSAWQSIKDAFDRSIALRCDYTDENGNKTVTYIKNKRIYFESEPLPMPRQEGKTAVVRGLAKDDKMYIWGEESAKGLLFDFKDVKPGAEPAKMGDKEIRGTSDIIDKLEEKKNACRSESIPDSRFELPAGIEFISL